MKRFLVIEDERTGALTISDAKGDIVDSRRLSGVVCGGPSKGNDREIFEAVAEILNTVTAK
jgi:hypothetical protein